MSVRPRVVIIEDEEGWQEDLKTLMEAPSSDWCERLRICGFRVVIAGWVEQALELLQRSIDDNDPFEAVLLDIGLPRTEHEAKSGVADQNYGRLLLTDIANKYDIGVVILTKHHKELVNVQHAVRQGVVDFYAKHDFPTPEGPITPRTPVAGMSKLKSLNTAVEP